MFKTAIIVSQNSKFCSQKQGTDRLFPLVNAMKESDYIVYYGTPEGTFSFLFLSCAHKLLTRFNNIITRLNDLLCRMHKLVILF